MRVTGQYHIPNYGWCVSAEDCPHGVCVGSVLRQGERSWTVLGVERHCLSEHVHQDKLGLRLSGLTLPDGGICEVSYKLAPSPLYGTFGEGKET